MSAQTMMAPDLVAPDSRANEKPPLRDDFIRAMRSVASSVTVVTSDGPAGRCGATVSAFSSVSADPPMVLICLNTNSRIAAAVAGNGCFHVNLLPQTHRHVADRFAGCHDAHVSDRFEDIDCFPMNATPAISGATVFCCSVHESLVAATHQVFFGTVSDVFHGGAKPLTYLDGAYHRTIPLPKAAT